MVLQLYRSSIVIKFSTKFSTFKYEQKNVLIFEKKGGADAFENDPSFVSKGTVACSIY